jgi:hypothetical protein
MSREQVEKGLGFPVSLNSQVQVVSVSGESETVDTMKVTSIKPSARVNNCVLVTFQSETGTNFQAAVSSAHVSRTGLELKVDLHSPAFVYNPDDPNMRIRCSNTWFYPIDAPSEQG